MRTIRMLLASVVCIRGRSRSQKGTVALLHVQVVLCTVWVRQKQGLHALLVMGKGYDLIHALLAGEATPLTRHLFSHLLA